MDIKIWDGELRCPFCGAPEVENPEEKDVHKWVWNIRAFRVDDSSECLRCGRWFSIKDLKNHKRG
jgi:DNA-directed RNA polymerase subunit RPC12/RpoP